MKNNHHTLGSSLALSALFALGSLPFAGGQHGADVVPTNGVTARPSKTKPVVSLQLAQLQNQADFVFSGRVVDKQNVLSQDGGAGRPSLPHTFITYEVDSVFKGTAPGKYVTLRFIGGYDPVRGAHMASSNSPRIDLGDEDLLFVQGNGVRATPLVQEDRGRLRVIKGRVYTEMGHAVVRGTTGALEVGFRYQLDDVRTTVSVNGEIHTIGLGEALTGPSNALLLGELLQELRSLPAPQQVTQAVAFQSADPAQPFFGPDFTAVAPPADPAATAQGLTPEERAEIASQDKPRRGVSRKPGVRRSTKSSK